MPDNEHDQPARKHPGVHPARTAARLTGKHPGSAGGGKGTSSEPDKVAIKPQSAAQHRRRRLLWGLLALCLMGGGGSVAIFYTWEALR